MSKKCSIIKRGLKVIEKRKAHTDKLIHSIDNLNIEPELTKADYIRQVNESIRQKIKRLDEEIEEKSDGYAPNNKLGNMFKYMLNKNFPAIKNMVRSIPNFTSKLHTLYTSFNKGTFIQDLESQLKEVWTDSRNLVESSLYKELVANIEKYFLKDPTLGLGDLTTIFTNTGNINNLSLPTIKKINGEYKWVTKTKNKKGEEVIIEEDVNIALAPFLYNIPGSNNYILNPEIIKIIQISLPLILDRLSNPEMITEDKVAVILGYKDLSDYEQRNGDMQALSIATKQFQENGFPMYEIATDIGQIVFHELGIKANDKEFSRYTKEEMILALGSTIIKQLVTNPNKNATSRVVQSKPININGKDYNLYKFVHSYKNKEEFKEFLHRYTQFVSRLSLNPFKQQAPIPADKHSMVQDKQKNTFNEPVTDEALEFISDEQEVIFEGNNALEPYLALDDDTAIKIAGGKDLGTVPLALRNNTKSKNEDYKRRRDNLMLYLSDVMNGFKVKWFQAKNGRTHMNSAVEPQDNKIHRHTTRMPSQVTTLYIKGKSKTGRSMNKFVIDNQIEFRLFKLALTQAFDLDTDKVRDETALAALDEMLTISGSGVKINEGGKKKGLDKAIKVAHKLLNKEELTQQDKDDLVAFINTTEGMHGFHALIELARLDKALKDPEVYEHKTDLHIESDAITSGMIITLLQALMVNSNKNDRRDIINLLAKGGIYHEDSTTFGIEGEVSDEYIKTLIEKVKKGELTHGTLLDPENKNNPKLHDFYNTLAYYLTKYGQEVLDYINGKEIENEQTIEDTITPNIKDSVKNIFQMYLNNDNVLEFKRSLVKPAQMVFTYGAATYNIIKKMYYSMIISNLQDKFSDPAFDKISLHDIMVMVRRITNDPEDLSIDAYIENKFNTMDKDKIKELKYMIRIFTDMLKAHLMDTTKGNNYNPEVTDKVFNTYLRYITHIDPEDSNRPTVYKSKKEAEKVLSSDNPVAIYESKWYDEEGQFHMSKKLLFIDSFDNISSINLQYINTKNHKKNLFNLYSKLFNAYVLDPELDSTMKNTTFSNKNEDIDFKSFKFKDLGLQGNAIDSYFNRVYMPSFGYLFKRVFQRYTPITDYREKLQQLAKITYLGSINTFYKRMSDKFGEDRFKWTLEQYIEVIQSMQDDGIWYDFQAASKGNVTLENEEKNPSKTKSIKNGINHYQITAVRLKEFTDNLAAIGAVSAHQIDSKIIMDALKENKNNVTHIFDALLSGVNGKDLFNSVYNYNKSIIDVSKEYNVYIVLLAKAHTILTNEETFEAFMNNVTNISVKDEDSTGALRQKQQLEIVNIALNVLEYAYTEHNINEVKKNIKDFFSKNVLSAHNYVTDEKSTLYKSDSIKEEDILKQHTFNFKEEISKKAAEHIKDQISNLFALSGSHSLTDILQRLETVMLINTENDVEQPMELNNHANIREMIRNIEDKALARYLAIKHLAESGLTGFEVYEDLTQEGFNKFKLLTKKMKIFLSKEDGVIIDNLIQEHLDSLNKEEIIHLDDLIKEVMHEYHMDKLTEYVYITDTHKDNSNKIPSRTFTKSDFYDSIDENKLNNFSGGATGADRIWAELISKVFGSKAINRHILPIKRGSREWHKTSKDTFIQITNEENRLGQEANEKAKNNTHYMNNRNYFQIINADNVYAVMPLNINLKSGEGGTNSAVKLAIKLNKTIYVLNTRDNKYYKYNKDTKTFEPVKIKDITYNSRSAFIGTRELEYSSYTNKNGEKVEIQELSNSKELQKSMLELLKHLKNISKNTNKNITIKETNTNVTNIQSIDDILKDITGSSLTDRKKLVENLVKLGINKDDAAMIIKMTANKEGITKHQTLHKALHLIKQYLIMNDPDKIHNLAIKLSKLNELDTTNLYEKVNDILTEEYNNLHKQVEDIIDVEIGSSTYTKSMGKSENTRELTNKKEVENFLNDLLTPEDTLLKDTTLNNFISLIGSFFKTADKLKVVEFINKTFNRGSADIMRNVIKLSKGTGLSLQTEAEVFMHEMTHLLTEKGIQADAKTKTRILLVKKQILELLKKDGVDPETFFIPEGMPHTEKAKQRSKELYEYMQTSPSEFLTIAVTNPILNKYINDNYSKIKTKSKLIDEIETNNIVDTLFNYVIKAINYIFDKIDLNKNTLDKELQDILITAVRLTQLVNERKYEPEENRSIEALYKLMDNIVKITKYREITNPIFNNIKKNYSKLENTFKEAQDMMDTSTKWAASMRTINRITKTINFDFVKLIRDLTKEMFISNANFSEFYRLFSKIKYIQETLRMHIETANIELLDSLVPGLNKKQLKSLTTSILKTDIASIRDINRIKRFIRDDSIRNVRIHEIEKELGKFTFSQAKINQAKALAYYMLTGVSTLDNLMLNANNIANGTFTGSKIATTEREIQLIDELISLYALNYTPKEDLNILKHYVNTHPKKFNKLITYIRNGIHTKTNELFEEDVHKIKGYIRPKSNNLYETKVISSKDLKTYKSYGWTEIVTIGKDSKESGTHDTILVKRLNTEPSYTKGAFEITGMSTMGITLTDKYTNKDTEDNKLTEALVLNMIKKIAENSKINESQDFDPRKEYSNLLSKKETKVVPILDLDGNIVNYRYTIHNSDMEEHSGLNMDIRSVISNTQSHMYLKINGREWNKKMIDYFIKSYDPKKPNRYVKVGIETISGVKIKHNEEYYDILPQDTKDYLYKATKGKNFIYVDKYLLNDTFGFKDASIANIPIFHNTNLKYLREKIKLIEKLWKDLIKLLKPGMVIVNGAVLYGNFASNFFVLSQFMSPVEVYREFRKNWILFDKLNKDLQRKHILDSKVSNGIADSKDKRELKVLNISISKNRMSYLVENGIVGSIIEDATISNINDTNLISNKINSYIDKNMNETTKSIIKSLFLTEDSAPFKKAIKIMQYSDVVAKQTYMDYLIKQGKSKEEAILEADQYFVNYNLNENKYIKYLNDTGAFMFSKFVLGTVKVVLNTIGKSPEKAIRLFGINNIVDVPEIYESYNQSLTDIITNRSIHIYDELFNRANPLALWERMGSL